MGHPAAARESSREDPNEGMPTVKQWVGTEDMRGGQGAEKGGMEQILYFCLVAPGQFLYCNPLGDKESDKTERLN